MLVLSQGENDTLILQNTMKKNAPFHTLSNKHFYNYVVNDNECFHNYSYFPLRCLRVSVLVSSVKALRKA